MSAGLRSRREPGFDAAINAAGMRADGDALLAEALPQVTGWHRVVVAAALGDVRGPDGAAALQQALKARGPGTRDLACAAALALAKRGEPSTTQDLLATLTTSKDGVVREYAVAGLAYAGDGTGWDDVLDWLDAQLCRPQRPLTHEPPLIFALCYLLTHVENHPDGTGQIASVLNARRGRLTAAEQEWLSTHWPQLPSGSHSGPGRPPTAATLRSWVTSRPLFH